MIHKNVLQPGHKTRVLLCVSLKFLLDSSVRAIKKQILGSECAPFSISLSRIRRAPAEPMMMRCAREEKRVSGGPAGRRHIFYYSKTTVGFVETKTRKIEINSRAV
jgi:hypothetical protein